MGLGSELVLLSIGPKGRPRFSPELAYALVAAELFELAQDGRIELLDDRIKLLDRTPIGSIPADEQLKRMASLTNGVGTLSAWLERRAPFRIEIYVDGLRALGVIRLRLTPMGDAGPVRSISVNDPAPFEAAERRLLDICESHGVPAMDDLAFAVLARVGKCADAHLRGWSHRRLRTALDEFVRLYPAGGGPGRSEGSGGAAGPGGAAEELLAECLRLIPELARMAPKKVGDSRTLDQQIGLTPAGRNAALYW